MPLINCEVELILTLPDNYIIIRTNVANQNPTVTITTITSIKIWF